MFFPIGAFLFGIAFLAGISGHFDRVGRKATLVASMLVMGISTTLIGVLPGYAAAGLAAPVLLCLLRLGQGLGLGGEWGGAALFATENAPPGRRAWFGMFPQLGPSIGFLLANGLFLVLFALLTPAQFMAWGWRIPFLASAVLVGIGLYVRGNLPETMAFTRASARLERVRLPLRDVLARHFVPLLLGSLSIVVCYALFYTSTVFALGYGIKVRHIPRHHLPRISCASRFVAMARGDADRRRPRRPARPGGRCCSSAPWRQPAPASRSRRCSATGGTGMVLLFLVIELALMGFTFAPFGRAAAGAVPDLRPLYGRGLRL